MENLTPEQLKMHQCKKFKFWRRWLVSAGQADRCTRGSARTYSIAMIRAKDIRKAADQG